MDLPSLLTQKAGSHADKVALIRASDGSSFTFRDVERGADRVAASLQAWGLEKGDRVAIAMPNSPRFVTAYFGVLRAGGVVVPLNVMLAPPEMAKILDDAGARFVFTSEPVEDDVRTAAATAAAVEKVVSSSSDWDSLEDAAPDPVDLSADDLAVLSYTSGTTGEPKGAMLSHGNLISNLDQQSAVVADRVTEDDVLFLTLPMFHIFGLNVPLGLVVVNGATGLLVERFEPVTDLELIQRYGVTVLFGAPTMYRAWVATPGADQYDLSKVRFAISGAAALPEEVLNGFFAIFGVKIFEGYGLTETSPSVTTNRMGEDPRPGSIGKPLPGVELRLVDENGNDVEVGDPGEIIVRGPNVFKGYWNRKEETEAAFTPDGWLSTGDVAVQDEEGYLYLVDRKRDLIIVSGFNVFPSEVEAALVEGDLVKDAAVVGEKHPYTGEAVKAYVVLEDGVEATPEQILEDVSQRIARFKAPRSIEIVPELPRVLTGKVLRRALRT